MVIKIMRWNVDGKLYDGWMELRKTEPNDLTSLKVRFCEPPDAM